MTTLVLNTLGNFKIFVRLRRIEISPEDKRAFEIELSEFARSGIARK